MNHQSDREKTEQQYNEALRDLSAKIEGRLRQEFPGKWFDTYTLATWLIIIKNQREKERAQVKKLKTTPLQSAAKKFRKELEAHQERFVANAPVEFIEDSFYQGEIGRIQRGIKAAEAFLGQTDRFNYVKEIGNHLRQACKTAGVDLPNGLNSEKSVYRDLVTYLLGLIGDTKGRGTISEYLRGRQNRARSGKAKKAGAPVTESRDSGAPGGRENVKNAPPKGAEAPKKSPADRTKPAALSNHHKLRIVRNRYDGTSECKHMRMHRRRRSVQLPGYHSRSLKK